MFFIQHFLAEWGNNLFSFLFFNFLDILNDPGAKKAREVVFSALRDSCTAGDLSIQEALTAATDMFANNAKAFYKLSAADKQFNSTSFASPKNLIEERHSPEEDCILVRVMWTDTSGQLRCRVSLFSSLKSSVFSEIIFFYLIMTLMKSVVQWFYEWNCNVGYLTTFLYFSCTTSGCPTRTLQQCCYEAWSGPNLCKHGNDFSRWLPCRWD